MLVQLFLTMANQQFNTVALSCSNVVFVAISGVVGAARKAVPVAPSPCEMKVDIVWESHEKAGT